MSPKRILSGMRPTGRLHMGHYFGALTNWVNLQDEYECFFMVADLHVLTDHHNRLRTVPELIREMVADWIACGIDPQRNTLFVQSHIPEHLELAWIFGSLSPIGWLERCPTYKEKAQELEGRETPNYALLGYPVLQASDIALYKGELVPVGEDQVAHLELTREIMRRFNSTYKHVFPEPQPKLTKTPRLLGTDGQKKMSKSLGNVLEVGEDEKSLKKKVATMFTDPARVKRTDPGHPEICNVFTFHGLIDRTARVEQIRKDCSTAHIGCTECKAEMGEKLAAFLKPMREKRQHLLETKGAIEEILKRGDERARAVARKTMEEVRAAMFG